MKLQRAKSALLAPMIALLATTLAACGGGSAGNAAASPSSANTLEKVKVQEAWVPNSEQAGEEVAIAKGYYRDAGLDVQLMPGGPNVSEVTAVASGAADIGETSSSPLLMMAASNHVPVVVFAAIGQEHPFAYISKKEDPIRSAHDMIGKKIGIQQPGRVLLDALLAKSGMSEDQVKIVIVGTDSTPLLTGQVDAYAGWVTNKAQLAPLGNDYVALRLWDAGVKLYALPYFTKDTTLQKNPQMLQRFIGATAKGWIYTRAHPDEAIDILVKKYPSLDKTQELASLQALLPFIFTDSSKAGGVGAMDPKIWQDQIDTYNQLQQFKNGAPPLDKVMTTSILDATKDARKFN